MYEFFYDLANYANTNWAKGTFTQKEIASNAYTYTVECKASMLNKVRPTIQTLLSNLLDDMLNAKQNNDVDEEATFFYNTLIDYLKENSETANTNVNLNDLRMEREEGWT